MKNYKSIVVLAISLISATGCVFIANNGPKPCSPPRDAKEVGGGFEIFYKAPEDGTAVLADKRSGKTVRTLSLSEGEIFEFTSRVFDEKAYKEMGIDPKKADFVLYFYPKNPKPPVPPQPPLPPQAPQQ
ncbi:MAG: hypothetical protein FJ263_10035 [Planctomycetes bacterium]|nr:hypothetical protein [Planctomycetota bacterium]